jgi:site-specific DNA-methyltransferase (adenine-specific)
MSPLDVIEGRATYCVVHGDNREILPMLPEKSVTHVITDPPYETEAHTLGRRAFSGPSAEFEGGAVGERPLDFDPMDEEFRSWVGREMSRLATRWSVAFCQVEAAVRWQVALTASGDHKPRRIGIWVKPGAAPQFTGDRPGMGYESIVFTHRKGRSTWNGGGKHGVFTHTLEVASGRVHTTQKPLPLMLELVELFTDPGDIILDPFCGSGTTGVAALRLGRRFIGIEKDAKYAAVARERIEAETKGLSLRDVRHGQRGLFEVGP